MNNEVILEINRIYEIMGLNKEFLFENNQIKEVNTVSNKKLLTEASIFGKLKDVIDDFIGSVKIKPSQIAQNVIVGQVEVEKRIWTLLKNFIANPGLTQVTDAELVQFMKILRQNSDIVNRAYKFLVPNILSTKNINETQFIKNYSEALKTTGADLRTILTNTLGEQNATLLYNKISKKIDDFDMGNFKPEIKVPRPTTTEKILTPSQINKLSKVVSSSKTFYGDFRQVFKKNLDELKNEIYELSNGFEASIKNVSSAQDLEKLINAYSVEISRKLDLIELKASDAALEILQKNNLPPEIVNKLKESDDLFFKTFREIREDVSKGFFETVGDSLTEFVKELRDIFKGLFKFKDNTILKIFNPTTSVGQYFWFGQWASLSKLWKLAIRTSAGQNKAKYFFAAMVASGIGSIVGAVAVNTLMTFWEFFKAAWNTLTKGLCGEHNKIKGFDCSKIQFEMGDWYNDFKDNVLQGGFQAFVEVGWNNLMKEMSDHPVMSTLFRLIPGPLFTYPDSLAVKILDAIGRATGREGKIAEDLNLRKEIYSFFGTTEEETQEQIRQAEEDVKNEGIEDTPTPTPSPQPVTTDTTTNTTTPVDDTITLEMIKNSDAAKCLFTNGWSVSQVINEETKFVTHNSDWTQKYYLDIKKNTDGTLIIYYHNTTQKVCG